MEINMNNRKPYEFIDKVIEVNEKFGNTIEELSGSKTVSIESDKKEQVNHPAHYNSSCFEVIDFIELFNLDFSVGNAIKYICRAGKKNPDNLIEDLEKAKWYIEREEDFLIDYMKELRDFKGTDEISARKIIDIFLKGQNFNSRFNEEISSLLEDSIFALTFINFGEKKLLFLNRAKDNLTLAINKIQINKNS